MSNWWSRVELLARRITLPHGALISWQAQCFGWRRAEFHDKSACKGAILWRVAGRLSYFSTSDLWCTRRLFFWQAHCFGIRSGAVSMIQCLHQGCLWACPNNIFANVFRDVVFRVMSFVGVFGACLLCLSCLSCFFASRDLPGKMSWRL